MSVALVDSVNNIVVDANSAQSVVINPKFPL